MDKGFTIVEILVVITLMAVAAVIVVPNFRKFNEGQDLTQAVDDFKQALRITQSSAMSSIKCSSYPASKWKVSVKSAQFQTIAVCYDSVTSPTPEPRQTVIFPSSISISADSCGAGSDVDAEIYFTTNTVSFICTNGATPNWPFEVTLKSTNNNQTQVVFLTEGGLIY